MSNLALDLTEDLTKESAIRAAILGTPTRLPLVNCATSSSMSLGSEENGESRTTPAMEGSRFAYMMAVTAPMLVPQRPILEVNPWSLRWLTMHSTSFVSRTPSVTYSPSLMPDPPRSTANTVMRAGRSRRMASVASHRDPELPWR